MAVLGGEAGARTPYDRFHGSRAAFERDIARRRRSGHLAFSYGDVFERGRQTVAELATAMRRAAAAR